MLSTWILMHGFSFITLQMKFHNIFKWNIVHSQFHFIHIVWTKIHAMPFMHFQWMNDQVFMDEIKIINDFLSKNLSMIRDTWDFGCNSITWQNLWPIKRYHLLQVLLSWIINLNPQHNLQPHVNTKQTWRNVVLTFKLMSITWTS
jgi:hypothetical protein